MPTAPLIDENALDAFTRNRRLFISSGCVTPFCAFVLAAPSKLQLAALNHILKPFEPSEFAGSALVVLLKDLAATANEKILADVKSLKSRYDMIVAVGVPQKLIDATAARDLLAAAQSEKDLLKALWTLYSQSDFSLIVDDVVSLLRFTDPDESVSAPRKQDLLDLIFHAMYRDDTDVFWLAHLCLAKMWASFDDEMRQCVPQRGRFCFGFFFGCSLLSNCASRFSLIRIIRAFSEATVATWANTISLLARGQTTRRLLLQVIVDHLMNPHTAITEKQQAARCFSLLAKHIQTNLLADFIFKVLFHPIRKAAQNEVTEAIMASSEQQTEPLSPRRSDAAPQDELSLNLNFLPEKQAVPLHGPQACVVVEFGGDVDIGRSFVRLEYATSEQVFECTLGVLLVVLALCRSPSILREFIRSRVAPTIANICFDSLSWGRLPIKKVAEEILQLMDSSPDAADVRPQILASLGQKQARQAVDLRASKARVIELEEKVEMLHIELDELKRVVHSLAANLGKTRATPELKNLTKLMKRHGHRRTPVAFLFKKKKTVRETL